jgi:hypothetical protein
VVTKSGTNEFHGAAFEFHRDNHLSTNDYFSEQANVPKPIFRQNQFGGVLGGPIKKNSTFFFVSYEGTRKSQGQAILSIVPTAAQLSGDMTLDALGSPAPPIFDPATTRTVNGVTVRDPFPGNMIPANRIDPAMTAYAKVFLPAPNTNVNGNNLLNTSPNVLNGNQGMIRVDQRFGNNNTLTGRFNINVYERDDQRYSHLRGAYGARCAAGLSSQQSGDCRQCAGWTRSNSSLYKHVWVSGRTVSKGHSAISTI